MTRVSPFFYYFLDQEEEEPDGRMQRKVILGQKGGTVPKDVFLLSLRH